MEKERQHEHEDEDEDEDEKVTSEFGNSAALPAFTLGIRPLDWRPL
jgi:hypothetical protein